MEKTPTPTLIGILWKHSLQALDKRGLRRTLRPVGLSFIAGILSAIALYPERMSFLFDYLMTWHGYAIPTVVSCFIFTFSVPVLFRMASETVELKPEPEGDTIEGMDKKKLIQHLIKHGTFKRNDIEQAFGIPRNRYSAFVKKMKEIGAFKSEANNMTVLADGWTAEKLTQLFAGKQTASELERPINIVRPSHSPTLAQKRQKVDSPQETIAKPSGFHFATVSGI